MYYVTNKKKNIFFPVQVKNKQSDGEMEHAFILGSMDSTVANNNKHKRWR
jgi:hypothetical protein